MSKQIYIDSNGTEIPVSGTITTDNNLPHFSGTPTAGTTAEAIASRAKIIEYTPTTNTATITADAIGAVCMVFLNRGYNAYDGSFEFITGGNTNNAQLIEKYKGTSVTATKTDGLTFTLTAGTELPSSTIYLVVISGEWTITG